MAGRRPSDREFLSLPAVPARPPGSDLDGEGRFLLPPLAGRDLAWVLECCRETPRGIGTCCAAMRRWCSRASATSPSPAI